MDRDISQESKNYEDLLNGNCDDLEEIIQKEPQKSNMKQWVIIKWINYYLIGIVVSKFEIDGINNFKWSKNFNRIKYSFNSSS